MIRKKKKMPSDKTKSSKILKIKFRKNLYRLRKFFAGLTMAGTVASSPLNVQAQDNMEKPSRSPADTGMFVADNHAPLNASVGAEEMLAYGRLIEVDIQNEINQRADWLVNEYLKATSKHLKAIKKATANGQKTTYVKNNFFNIVYPNGGLSGKNNYCITAINRALIDANRCGDFNKVLPQYDTEGAQAVECNRFIAYLTRKGFGDCIRQGTINTADLEPGDIVMTPRGGGYFHATTYIGNGKVRSFNSDGEWALKKRSGIVIKLRHIAQKAILLELQNKRLIDVEKGNPQVVPIQDAQKMMQFFYKGRKTDNNGSRTMAALRIQTPHYLAAAATRRSYTARRNGWEI